MISSPIEEIKNRLNIVEVIGGYLKLQKAGANYRALCPFHQEKGPSFFVSPARQMWHCFGCSLGGDAFKFIMQIEGVEFGDALRQLAQKTGVELPQRDPAFAKMQSERKGLYELMELATKFFEKQFSSSKVGEEAKAYLLDRGVTQASLEKWRIGYAPESARGLVDFLLEKGCKENEIGKAGLLVRTEQGMFDRFRSRIIFPVFDLNSQVIGFGGRIFGKKEGQDLAKYINTPNTPLYDKSSILYGLDKAKLEIRKKDRCVLVEGYMDVILVAQAGYENVVATSGTALTTSHLRLLKRYSENLLLAFDMDVAGDSATKRGIDLAVSEGFAIKVATLEDGKDPADIALQDAGLLSKFIEEAKSIFDFYFTTTLSRFDKKTPEGKKEIAKVLLPFIKKIPNKIEQAHWIQQLSLELEVKEEVIIAELQKTEKSEEEPFKRIDKALNKTETVQKPRKELLQERIITFIFLKPDNLLQLEETDVANMSLSMQEIIAGFQKNKSLDFTQFEQLFPASTVEFLKYLSLKAEVEESELDGSLEFQICLRELQMITLKEKLDALAIEIKKAEDEKDVEKLKLLVERFHTISRDLLPSLAKETK